MVTWGTDTVRHFNTSTTTPAPSSGFSFASPQPAPGASAAPSTGGLFGAAPSPAAGGAFGFAPAAPTTATSPFSFASAAASSSGGIFGAAPAPGSIFGAPAGGGGIFGTAAPTAFQQPQQLPPQEPADAALQAHIDASNRNEEARVRHRMQKTHFAYTTGTEVTADEGSHCFSIPLYNPVTAQERQFQAAYSSAVNVYSNDDHSKRQLFVPPRPPQISQADWDDACVRNPDAYNFMPVAVVGAESLKARAVLQQSQANAIVAHISKLTEVVDDWSRRLVTVQQQLNAAKRTHALQRVQLLKVLKHVEVARCFNLPLQPKEMEAKNCILHLNNEILQGKIEPSLARVTNATANAQSSLAATMQSAFTRHEGARPSVEQQRQWMHILKQHRATLTKMTETTKADQQDLHLIRDRISTTAVLHKRPTYM
jgi:Nucleoporin complex subunit 54